MSEQTTIEHLSDDLKQYINTNYELLKLEAVDNVSAVASSAVSYLLVGVVSGLFLFFMSLGVGFYISFCRGDSYSGFVIVAGFYFLLAVVLLIARKKGVANPIRNKIIEKIVGDIPPQ